LWLFKNIGRNFYFSRDWDFLPFGLVYKDIVAFDVLLFFGEYPVNYSFQKMQVVFAINQISSPKKKLSIKITDAVLSPR